MKRIKYDIIYTYRGTYCLKGFNGYWLGDGCAMHHESDGWVLDDLNTGCRICSHRNKDELINRFVEIQPRLAEVRKTIQYTKDVNIFTNTTARYDELINRENDDEVDS